ncbi:hypothetical protein C1T17_19390 [Sphingobium sp. SCG-1]|uniref:tetratricopeptide repeat protein n=1 Tax=Sphingobium sp. SCG-1 TaxID=2072936 RepID=UPI000CD685A3|nr:tetratricopeptide repeat protein [Sphingobium sp. SCG-1]AUW59919.1 hypothetical protein C1T17_19390 [Sphingobium sp. SCG-1]
MALTPQSNEAFLREVDDAVRQDRLLNFWQRYGRWLIGVIVVGLLAFAGWLYWEHHSTRKSGETAEEMAKVLDVVAGGGTPDAAKLEALTKAGQPGYRAAAQLAKAAVAVGKGDQAGALAIYKNMVADSSLDKPYRDLALVRQTTIEFDKMKPADIVARLKPLAVAGDPWFGSAGEMTAIAYMKMGKPDLAGPIFAAMAKDKAVPQTIRSRARQMAGLLGIDAVDATENEESGNNAQ